MARELLESIGRGLGGGPSEVDGLDFVGEGALPSAFAVSDLAAAAVGAAALAAAQLVEALGAPRPRVRVDRRMASLWFGRSIEPRGWSLPPVWDPIAGDYRAADGWIRIHTNAPAHRAAALRALGAAADRDAVSRAVARRTARDLETAIVEAGGCAAEMRSIAAWAEHPQGRAVAAEPLVAIEHVDAAPPAARWRPSAQRPLRGVRVLDLTRVLAGPVATRFLAALGADVLRIDPPDWDEPAAAPEVTLGKRCARLDLRSEVGRGRLRALLADADVVVHGYRPGALEGLGLGLAERRVLAPALVDVTLDAYGWTGPWAGRRGFDSLVQMSAGIADAGMRRAGRAEPFPLPVQALDHATGYLLAAAALRGVTARVAAGRALHARASLARTAALLVASPEGSLDDGIRPANDADFEDDVEDTGWGPARRLRPPAVIEGCPLRWDRPASPLGTASARWADD